jgi:hypothetical protein
LADVQLAAPFDRLGLIPSWYWIVPVTPEGIAPPSLLVPTIVRFPTLLVPEAGELMAIVGAVASRVKSRLVWLVFSEP